MKKGSVVGLVGESGCGKSTLTKIILDLGETNNGQILIDGTRVTPNRRHEIKGGFNPFSRILTHRSTRERRFNRSSACRCRYTNSKEQT